MRPLLTLLLPTLVCIVSAKEKPKLQAPDTHQVAVNIWPANGSWPAAAELFKPREALQYHSGVIENASLPIKVSQITLRHKDHSYVNLELLEPFLEHGRVKCYKDAALNEQTQLELSFPSQHAAAFNLAKAAWKSNQYLFVVEGEHCFMGAGERSFFRSEHIDIDDSLQKITVKGVPLMAHLFASNEWRTEHNVTYYYLPGNLLALPRPSSGWTFGQSTTIAKRTNDDDGDGYDGGIDFHGDLDFSLDNLGGEASVTVDFGNRTYCDDEVTRPCEYDITKKFLPPKSINSSGHEWTLTIPRVDLYCLDCRRKGRLTASVNIHFDFTHHHKYNHTCQNEYKRSASDPPLTAVERHARLQPKIDVYLEAERRVRHQKRAQHLRKRSDCSPGDTDCDDPSVWLKPPACDENNVNWPVCRDIEIESPKDEAGKPCIHHDNAWLHPSIWIKEMIHCTAKAFFTGEHCWQKLIDDKNEFEDFGDFVHAFIKERMNDAKVELEVEEEIDLKLQLRAHADIDLGMFFDLDIYPWVVVPSFGALTGFGNGGSQIFPIGEGKPQTYRPNSGAKMPPKYKDNKGNNQVPRPWKGNQKGQNSGKGAQSSNNGMGWKMPWTLVPLTVEAVVKGHVSANITLPGFQVTIGKGKLSFDALRNDMVQNTLDIRTTYLPGDFSIDLNQTSLTLRVSAGPRFRVELIPGLGSLNLPGYLSQPLAIGGHIQPVRFDHILQVAYANDTQCPAGFEGGMKLGIYFRTGADLFAQVFFQRFDMTYLGMLDHSEGAVAGLWFTRKIHVFCLPVGQGIPEFVEKVRKLLREIQQPIVDIVGAIGPMISQFEHYEPAEFWNKTGTPQHTPDHELDYANWRERTFLNEPMDDASIYYGIDPAYLDPNSYLYIVPELQLTQKQLEFLVLESISPGSGKLVNDTIVQTQLGSQRALLNAIHPGAGATANCTLEQTQTTYQDTMLCAINKKYCKKKTTTKC